MNKKNRIYREEDSHYDAVKQAAESLGMKISSVTRILLKMFAENPKMIPLDNLSDSKNNSAKRKNVKRKSKC